MMVGSSLRCRSLCVCPARSPSEVTALAGGQARNHHLSRGVLTDAAGVCYFLFRILRGP